MTFSAIEFIILESSESNDHEVRVIINGEDWLGGNRLGIDPPQLTNQLVSIPSGELLVGRCHCGCVGCDDFYVEVRQGAEVTEWHPPSGKIVRFRTEDYLQRLDALNRNHSWEPTGRTSKG